MARNTRADGGGGEEDNPGDDPDGKEHADEHAEEANEEICVHAIDFFDFAIIGIPDGPWPEEKRGSKGFLAFAE